MRRMFLMEEIHSLWMKVKVPEIKSKDYNKVVKFIHVYSYCSVPNLYEAIYSGILCSNLEGHMKSKDHNKFTKTIHAVLDLLLCWPHLLRHEKWKVFFHQAFGRLNISKQHTFYLKLFLVPASWSVNEVRYVAISKLDWPRRKSMGVPVDNK